MSDQVKVLDKGFVRLVDAMGSDCTVVNAARISFGKSVTEISEKDVKLIGYLAKHGHWTPFAHPQITLHIKMPIFVARQYMKSNVGVVYNEVSRRYVDEEPEFYEDFDWRKRPEGSVKQGSGSTIDNGIDCHRLNSIVGTVTMEAYKDLLNLGVAPEMARMVLPVSMYTEVWATMSLMAAARIVGLRKDAHAQLEIQRYAEAMDALIAPRFPHSWSALTGS